MKNEQSNLLMGAIAGLLLLSASVSAETKPTSAKTVAEEVLCHGVNSCKGQGTCHGKVDACSGKNDCSSETSCAGKNSCKGKGLIKLSKKDCLAKGGKIASN